MGVFHPTDAFHLNEWPDVEIVANPDLEGGPAPPIAVMPSGLVVADSYKLNPSGFQIGHQPLPPVGFGVNFGAVKPWIVVRFRLFSELKTKAKT